MPKYELSTDVNASIETAYALIKNIEAYPSFMHFVKTVKIIRSINEKIVSEWKVDFDGTPIDWVEEDVFDDINHTFSFRTIKGDYKYEGQWVLVSEAKDKTKIILRASYDWEIPNFEKYFGHVYDRKAKLSLRTMLIAVKKKLSSSIDKFAFLFHPADVDLLFKRGFCEVYSKNKNKRLIERSLRWLPPVRRETAIVKSLTGRTIAGEMVLVPLICEQILNMDQSFILKKTIDGAKLAKTLGVKLVGLGAYLSPVGRRGVLIEKAINLPVTSGTTYTIAMAIEATIKAAERTELDLSKARVAIVGATGSIGKVCACYLADKVDSLVLIARNKERLSALQSEIREIYNPHIEISCSDNINDGVRSADIVMISTNNPVELLSAGALLPGCIVCDISVPHNISEQDALDSEVLVVDGGLVKCPDNVNFDYLNLPPGEAYACLSEVMILAFEGRFESFSSGGEISVEKVIEITKMGTKHGFSLAEFRSFGVSVSEEKIEKVKKAIKRR